MSPDKWNCTERTATFCPIHGSCRCLRFDEAMGHGGPVVRIGSNRACPLHGPATAHAVAVHPRGEQE